MEGQTLNLVFFIIFLLLLDWYVFNGLRSMAAKWKFLQKKWFPRAYWGFSIFLLAGILLVIYIKVGFALRMVFILAFFILLLFKLSFVIVLLVDDIRRLAVYIAKKTKKQPPEPQVANAEIPNIPRSEFLVKAGLLAGIVPLAALRLNMSSGCYDYQVKRHKLYLPNLPKAFDGMKLAQISDIHSGSFFNKRAVLGGVEMLLREKADVIFFTGDLVNSMANEMRDYQDIFSMVKAPLGVFSSLGNHDYSDYAGWMSPRVKKINFDNLV